MKSCTFDCPTNTWLDWETCEIVNGSCSGTFKCVDEYNNQYYNDCKMMGGIKSCDDLGWRSSECLKNTEIVK